ncbi:MAG: adenosylmethionine decarboxylase [Moraxellaceae bacterium]|nr:adenosylmethionine decarboxylase [Moraxellaceae bacterium]
MKPLGQHYLLECDGVEAELLANPTQLHSLLYMAAQAAQAQVLFAHCHHFGAGQGVTGVLLLQESHISIHTWPEYSYAAIDVFMCGEAQPQCAVDYLINCLQPTQHRYQMVERSPQNMSL